MRKAGMKILENKAPIAAFWGIGFAMGVLVFILITRSNDNSEPMHDTYLQVLNKTELLSRMRINLHKSVEMEKNAVMALTDEESQEYANQSLIASASVKQDLKKLQSLIATTRLQDEENLVDEFNTCWVKFHKLDQSILGLAVQNTNLKAAALSEEKGSEVIQRFEQSLQNVMRINLRTSQQDRVAGSAWQAIAASLQIFNLHHSHIVEIDDEKMNQIETQVKAEEKKVLNSLDQLDEIVDKECQNALLQAKTAFSEFMEVTTKVLELSKINSNIKSLELSIGKKRIISAQCEEILASLQKTVQSRPFKATK
jgi:hypothetical protein